MNTTMDINRQVRLAGLLYLAILLLGLAVLLPALVGEVALSGWMLLRGVNLARWQQLKAGDKT